MGFLLKAGLLESMKSPADVLKLMKSDLKNNANKKGVKFVAAKNYLVGGKPVSLFIVTDAPASFDTVLKKQPKALKAKGTCDLVKTDGKVQIVVKQASGQLGADSIAKMIPVALAKDSGFTANTAAGSLIGANAAKALEMARASHAEARKEGKLDWEFDPTPDVVRSMAQTSLQMPEYRKFAGNFTAFLSKYGLPSDGKLPTAIWNALLEGLIESGYIKSVIPKAEDKTSFVLAYKGPEGKPIREKLLAEAMKGLKPFVDHAARYMDKVIAKAGSGQTWAFWSGRGAEDSAKAAGGVSLEGSVGSFFAAYEKEWIDFPKLTGTETLPLWAAMSEMYAEKAAESMAKFKFIGFVGPTATRDQSVFNKIEQPTFVEVLTVRKRVAPPSIEWFVVDCEKDDKGNWVWTKKAPEKFSDRSAALARITQRYGG
jgi:hypothetical protein